MHKALELYLAHLLPLFSRAGIHIDEQREILYGAQLKLSKDKYKAVLNVYHSAKKGITTVAGGVQSPLKNLVQALLDGSRPESSENLAFHRWTAWIGADECGKGDYFGAPVVCAFAYDESLADDFKRMRIQDSKKLRDSEIIPIAKQLYARYPARIACIVIKPAKYNELIANFNKQNLNLNDLLAWLHSTNILNLQKTNPPAQGILVDQFSPSQKVRRALEEKKCPIPCVERTGAEIDPAVAAASIIARYQFVEAFKSMRQFYEVDFPLGATSKVITSALAFSAKYGFNRLGEVAKLHFKTTQQVQAKLPDNKS
jgi:ribonuclease HIII